MPSTPQSVSPVYMSGPMFSDADLDQQAALAAALKAAGMDTYLPQRDGLEVGKLLQHLNDPEPGVDLLSLTAAVQFLRELVFALDMYQLLVICKSVVFNMDGRVPDDGSVAETATAWASGLPIVLWKTTPITMLGGFNNPMLDGLSSNWAMVNDVTLLPKAILAAADASSALGPRSFTPGGQVTAVLTLGKFVLANKGTIQGILDQQQPDPKKMVTALLALAVQWESNLKAAYPDGPPVWLAPPPPA